MRVVTREGGVRLLHRALLGGLTLALCMLPPLALGAAAARAQSVLSPEVQILAPAMADSQFGGQAVAIADDHLLIGMPGRAGGDAGLVRVFMRSAGVWSPLAELRDPMAAASANFGAAIAIDGAHAVVGAPNHGSGAGAAFVFERSGSTWSLVATLEPPSGTPSRFGSAVAIRGTRVAVGAPGTELGAVSGSVAVYEDFGSASGVLLVDDPGMDSDDDLFGASVALAGGSLLVGAPGADGVARDGGVAYAFERSGSTWMLTSTLEAPDAVQDSDAGTSVALSADATIAAIGAPGHGASAAEASGRVFVFRRAAAGAAFTIAMRTALSAEDPTGGARFGTSVTIDGSRLLVGARQRSGVGGGYLFEDRGGTLVPTARFAVAAPGAITMGAQLGEAVGLSAETALLGAPRHDRDRGLVAVFSVPSAVGAMCSIDERCESGVCGAEVSVCCERDCGVCGRCNATGRCEPIMEAMACAGACGEGTCRAGVCETETTCDAGSATSDAGARPRVRVSGCKCRAGRGPSTLPAWVTVSALVATLTLRRRRRASR